MQELERSWFSNKLIMLNSILCDFSANNQLFSKIPQYLSIQGIQEIAN